MPKGKPVKKEIVKKVSNEVSLDNFDEKTFENALVTEGKKRDLLQKYISEQLVQGKDYGTIKMKTKSGKEYETKPTLFKAGAEKFISLLRLKPVWESDIETVSMLPDNLKAQGVFCFRCLLLNHAGETMAEGRGACSIAEKGNINVAVKIAKKRSMVDAVLTLGLSDTFTQDLDDTDTSHSDIVREKYEEPAPQKKRKWEFKHTSQTVAAGGRFKGTKYIDMPDWYLKYCKENATNPEAVQKIIDEKKNDPEKKMQEISDQAILDIES